jgi:hypothetical protein
MSMDDVEKTEKDVQKETAAKPCCRCRCSWRRLLLLLLVIVVVGGGALYWNFYLRVYNLKVCQDALKTIAGNKGMQETLGVPIKNVYWPSQETSPSARVEESEIDVIWTIEGPKKQARAHVNARRRQGRWDTVMLEVTPAGEKKVSIHEPDSGDGDGPPVWPNPATTKTDAKKPEVKKPDTKGPDINMPIPPGDAPAGMK